jgi:hypothetical protein
MYIIVWFFLSFGWAVLIKALLGTEVNTDSSAMFVFQLIVLYALETIVDKLDKIEGEKNK